MDSNAMSDQEAAIAGQDTAFAGQGAVPTDGNAASAAQYTMPTPSGPHKQGPLVGANSFVSALQASGGVPVQLQPMVSAEDVALYDRQIRLWGMEAQARIQQSHVLIITMRALGNEVAKNLVLAGVGSITLLDAVMVTETDLGSQFLLAESPELLGQNRAMAASIALGRLNPRVNIFVDTEAVSNKRPTFFSRFDVVIATDLDPDAYNIVNTATRLNNKKFYAAGSHGLYGFIFSDLIEHVYYFERDQANLPTIPDTQETRTRSVVDVKLRRDGPKTVEVVTKRELYSTWFLASDLAPLPDDFMQSRRRLRAITPVLSCLRALWHYKQQYGPAAWPATREHLKLFTQIAQQKHKALGLPTETLSSGCLRRFLQNIGCEIASVAAIVGGHLAQDTINVISHWQQPMQNMIVFDGERIEASMFPLHPEGVLGRDLLSLDTTNPSLVPPGAAALDSTLTPPVPMGVYDTNMSSAIPQPPPASDHNGSHQENNLS